MELEPRLLHRLNVRSCVVVSTASPRGISNAAPFSFNSPISFSPPLFGISCQPGHDTWRNIKERGEFVVNFVDERFGEVMQILDRKYPYEVSEVEKAGLTESPAVKLSTPRIKEAYAWLECRLYDSRELGDHIWITGEVLQAEIKDECYEKALNTERCPGLLHSAGEDFAVPQHRKYKRA